MKLRNGKISQDYKKCWWYPSCREACKRRHTKSNECYCSNLNTMREWIEIERKEREEYIQHLQEMSKYFTVVL